MGLCFRCSALFLPAVSFSQFAVSKRNSVWLAQRVCEELVRHGPGADVLPIVRRTTAVQKSAGNAARPSLEEHIDPFASNPDFDRPADSSSSMTS